MPSTASSFPLPAPPLLMPDESSLFLDFDGTLVDLADRPDGVVVDRGLTELLVTLADRLPGRVAIVSGRSIDQLDALLGQATVGFALSGSHGSEHRIGGIVHRPPPPAGLDRAALALRQFAETRQGVIVETKSYGVALHYRQSPDAEPAAHRLAAELAAQHTLGIQHGKMMVELRLAAGDKGSAVRRLMAGPPMAGTRPMFLGDDLTDEPGFVACKDLGGSAILVGPSRETAAGFGLPDVDAVRAWLTTPRAEAA